MKGAQKNMQKELHKVNEFWADTSKNLDALENEFKRFDVCMGVLNSYFGDGVEAVVCKLLA